MASGSKINRALALKLAASTILVGLVWEGAGEPEVAVMSRMARNLSDRFQNLAGTEETELYGLPQEEVRVEIDPRALAAAGLSMGEAAQLIAAADAKSPAGQMRGERANVGVEVGGEFAQPEDQ